MKRLTSENKQLEKQVIRLEAQSDILKREFIDFQKMISSSAGLNLLWRGNTNPRLQYAEENSSLQYASSSEVPETEVPVSESAAVEDSKTTTTSKTSDDFIALLSVLVMLQTLVPHFNTATPLLAKALLATQSNTPVNPALLPVK